ncbi:MAG: type II toxin-antitoxin system VapC family toxin [Armatimonadetes bacterium]|nr:type II toxin-antitoxin system VapC family toxin [Armatimonadota bacterium]
MQTSICLDASFVMRMAWDGAASPADAAWRSWKRAGIVPAAPLLLAYEVTNALYRYVAAGKISRHEAEDMLSLIFHLKIRFHRELSLHARALQMAADLGLPAAYDAHYLALARDLGAELWTADARLHERVHVQLSWVRLVGKDTTYPTGPADAV